MPKAVQDALNGIVSSAADSSRLEDLLIVARAVDDPSAPRTPLLRRMTLQGVLMDLIVTEVDRLRQSHGLASYPQSLSLADAFQDIVAVGQKQKPVLTGWVWLYYRYVRSELAVSPMEFSSNAGITDRTLRRYADQAVEALTKQLVALEWTARRAQVQHRLAGQLPLPVVRLIGRESEQALLGTVLKQALPRHVQVIGPDGAGKSAFVQEVLRIQVADGALDELVWLTQPALVAAARAALTTQLLANTTATSLAEYTERYAVTVVLDGVGGCAVDELQTMLAELSSATVYLINDRYLPLEFAPARVYIRDLTHQAAVELIRLQLTLTYPEEEPFLDGEVETIWRDVGGNPRAILRAVQQSHTVFR